MEGRTDESMSVGVAVRVRPLNNKEKNESSEICIKVDSKDKLITIGSDRNFTFDQVFGMESKQEDVFFGCAKELVFRVFKGYNATILAYGQTGSGKTFTMGSGQLTNMKDEDIGIIPRVINMIFHEREMRKSEAEFIIKLNFIEIYNEEIHDLLSKNSISSGKTLVIREKEGSIGIDGICEEQVTDAEGTFACLERGTLERSVSSTLMNSQSSRSHAIFTIIIEKQAPQEKPDTDEIDHWVAKFHFVDLAGSERAKKTGASGATLKEGISINKGLLCLGNVISALTDESKRANHIPYRDSKLTRILQDSLGGNANTFMIACVSPAESNFDETLNTLKYASRARHIKNKPVVNTDPHSAMIAQFKLEIAGLRQEVINYQKVLSCSDNEDLKASLEILKKESSVISSDSNIDSHKSLQMEKRIAVLTSELEISRGAQQVMEIENFKVRKERDLFKSKVEQYADVIRINRIDIPEDDEISVKLVDEYLDIIEKLKKDKEGKDLVIKDLEYEYSNLMKELERDRILLKNKTQEIEKIRMRSNPGTEDLEELITKNVDDYGRIFAETVFATLEKQENPEETDVSTEVQEEFEEKEIEMQIQKEEILDAEGKIKEKEEKLKNIEDAFKELQAKLLEGMSKQYYKKIEDLQIEMKNTEKERDNALDKVKEKSSGEQKSVADKFKAKITSLEQQLHENVKKDRELTNMHKTLENQKIQLTKLSEDVKKEKKQKIDMQKKFKEEKDVLLKLKAQRQKEILLMKKTGAKKDQEIKTLKSENRKKEIIAKRKTEELAAVQKRQRDIALKRKGSGLAIGIETLKEWVHEYAKACVEEKELTRCLASETEEKDELESFVTELYTTYTEIKLKLERNELILSDNEPNIDMDELYSEIQNGKRETQEILDEIENLEERINFKQGKIIELSNKLANSTVEDIKSRGINMSSIENSQNLIAVLFDEILLKISKIKELKKVAKSKDIEISDLQSLLTQIEHEKEFLLKNHEIQINNLELELQEKKAYILHIIEESGKTEEDLTVLADKDEEIKKLKSRIDYYVNKYNKLCKSYNDIKENEYDKSKPRNAYNISASSLAKARNLQKHKKKVASSDNPEAQEEDPSTPRLSVRTPLVRNSHSSKSIAAEDDSVFDRLQRPSILKSRTSIGADYCWKPTQRWREIKCIEAHEGPISSMFCSENMIYTASNQKFKIWSLEHFGCIGEVAAHKALIRSMVYWPEKGSLFTSCGNLINLYDTFTLTKAASFRGHADEIRAMKLSNNLLYCAGKGNPNSIFIWDLRKLDAPLQEKEKGLDAFSLLIGENTLYYGCRDHKIHRMRISDFEVLKSYETAHYDAVTCLASYNNCIVSGSRDKNLRIWDPEGEDDIKTIISAHTDWINCLTTDPLDRGLYSGGKEGKVRVWSGSASDINYAGELLGHTGSVNAISALNSTQQAIISASSDKTIRLWKLDEEIPDDEN